LEGNLMSLYIEKMNENVASDVLSWKYDEPYDFYNNELTHESVNGMLIGLGLRPELTVRGYGALFLPVVLSYIIENFGNIPMRLTVAKFNQRGIRLYKKFGFKQEAEFIKGDTDFIAMILRYPLN
jgi:ribosomal-protein-alanine N-acetyltransferase